MKIGGQREESFIWTLQDKSFLNQKGEFLICPKKYIPVNWKYAYRWLEEQYQHKKGIKPRSALIWVWIQRSYSEKAFYMAITQLYSSYEYGLKNKVALVLKIPQDVILLSSYNRWNILLEYCMEFKRKPDSKIDWQPVFRIHDIPTYDYIQGVIPFIKRNWIKKVIELDAKKLKRYGADFRKKF
ncbi:MAG: hypothetical protein NC923_00595 [Candidatus Omnitrophica bacterium]|nr:hypothetical protein [Candidatus Omnitrophota bacterium]